MKKILSLAMACLLFCSLMATALANSWGASGGVYDIVSNDHAYDDYVCADCTDSDYVAGRHVTHAVLKSRYHNLLMTTYRDDNGAWREDVLSTTAVYQPDDARSQVVEIEHANGGLKLIYNKSEEYYFVYEEGKYILWSVLFDTDSFFGGSYSRATEDSKEKELGNYVLWQSDFEGVGNAIGDAVWRVDDVTLDEFNITLLPRTMSEVRRSNHVSAALLEAAAPFVFELRAADEKGIKLPVYAAPSEDAYRAANGKASVSTAGEMKVLGAWDGWTLIEYEVSQRTSRIGYVEAVLEDAQPLDFTNIPLVTACDTYLTDDPFVSQYAQVNIKANKEVTGLKLLNDYYAYVSYNHGGQEIWGFVPLKDLQLMADENRWDVMDSLIGKWRLADEGAILADLKYFFSDGTYQGRSLDDRSQILESGTWHVVECEDKAAYEDVPLYEIFFVLNDGTGYRYALSINDDGSITMYTNEESLRYTRNEYSTYGNG